MGQVGQIQGCPNGILGSLGEDDMPTRITIVDGGHDVRAIIRNIVVVRLDVANLVPGWGGWEWSIRVLWGYADLRPGTWNRCIQTAFQVLAFSRPSWVRYGSGAMKQHGCRKERKQHDEGFGGAGGEINAGKSSTDAFSYEDRGQMAFCSLPCNSTYSWYGIIYPRRQYSPSVQTRPPPQHLLQIYEQFPAQGHAGTMYLYISMLHDSIIGGTSHQTYL